MLSGSTALRDQKMSTHLEDHEMSARDCPALLISAPASGAGKTTVTAGIARCLRNQGRTVRVFKTGPDFLDPMILARASGYPVYQLDLWMVGEPACRQLLFEAANTADLILIEGVMGLFDGPPSSADLAQQFGVPVLAVIDASAMAQTFGAVALGLATHEPGLNFAGVLANRVAGGAHSDMLAESMPNGIRYFGHLPHDQHASLPDRHLGLMQAQEIADLDARLDATAAAIASTRAAGLPNPVAFVPAPSAELARLLDGIRIGVARDSAFAFIYQANLDLLEEMGAKLAFFSPLTDRTLPEIDSLWLPGGYPELHLTQLEANTSMKKAIRRHQEKQKPIVAECGGMLYLLESLTDAQGNHGSMVGLLPGQAVMQPRLTNLGLQQAALPEGTLRGHTFHHTRTKTTLQPAALTEDAHVHGRGEPVYRVGRLHASYIHLYFPSNPEAIARLFQP